MPTSLLQRYRWEAFHVAAICAVITVLTFVTHLPGHTDGEKPSHQARHQYQLLRRKPPSHIHLRAERHCPPTHAKSWSVQTASADNSQC